jgi:hypothetical protein
VLVFPPAPGIEKQTTTPQRYCMFTEICGYTSKVAVNRNTVERENVPRLLQKLNEGGALLGFELHSATKSQLLA